MHVKSDLTGVCEKKPEVQTSGSEKIILKPDVILPHSDRVSGSRQKIKEI